MRIFTDTNVLVSAFMTRGLCADLFEIIVAEHELLIGEPVMTELKRILGKKFRAPAALVERVEAELRLHTVVPRTRKPLELPIRDKEDPLIVACALAAKADIFVTGDQELLGLQTVQDMPIISPRTCWQQLHD